MSSNTKEQQFSTLSLHIFRLILSSSLCLTPAILIIVVSRDSENEMQDFDVIVSILPGWVLNFAHFQGCGQGGENCLVCHSARFGKYIRRGLPLLIHICGRHY